MNRFPMVSRRQTLQYSTVGVASASLSGWLGALASQATTPARRTRSVILLWLTGGPSTIDLWDLKPQHENGGPFRPIATQTPGVQISEHLPKLAKLTNDIALIRSVSSAEGDHSRALHFLRTGYKPQASIQFPALGSLLAHEARASESDLPNFVSIALPRTQITQSGGFLGPRFATLVVDDGGERGKTLDVPNLQRTPGVGDSSQNDRVEMLSRLNNRFLSERNDAVVDSIQVATQRAVRLMRPEAAQAFDLSREPDALRDSYGRSLFGQGCLLARRLVERDVPFVEVALDGWDTHASNFDRVKALSGTLDLAFAALVADLKNRGLLDSTLIVCQGEFGRTPKINSNTGRDHWPQSWAVAMAGGGIKTGQAIGATTDDGMAVKDQPIRIPDLLATISKAVGVDPMKQNPSNVGRPIRIADPSAKLIEGLL